MEMPFHLIFIFLLFFARGPFLDLSPPGCNWRRPCKSKGRRPPVINAAAGTGFSTNSHPGCLCCFPVHVVLDFYSASDLGPLGIFCRILFLSVFDACGIQVSWQQCHDNDTDPGKASVRKNRTLSHDSPPASCGFFAPGMLPRFYFDIRTAVGLFLCRCAGVSLYRQSPGRKAIAAGFR